MGTGRPAGVAPILPVGYPEWPQYAGLMRRSIPRDSRCRTLHQKLTCIGYIQCDILVSRVQTVPQKVRGRKACKPQEAFKPAALQAVQNTVRRTKGEDSGAILGPPLLCCLARDTTT